MPFRFERLIILAVATIALVACDGQVLPPSQEAESTYITPVEELEAQSGDLKLYIRRAGGPQPDEVLIVTNGGPGQSSHYILDLEQLASPELAVVTYDQRGTGRSESPPPGSDNFELADYIADLEAVRQAVGVAKVHLLGHSWGVLVTTGYAIAYPENVASLTLMGGDANLGRDAGRHGPLSGEPGRIAALRRHFQHPAGQWRRAVRGYPAGVSVRSGR